jgi:hypothetical protein
LPVAFEVSVMGNEPKLKKPMSYCNIQLNNEVTVTLTLQYDIGFFNFGSFPITLTSKATGKSEVYWK